MVSLIRFLRRRWRTFGFLAIVSFGFPVLGQFDRTYVNFSCPCTLKSSDGETAELTFGIKNNTDAVIDELYATVGIVAYELVSDDEEENSNTAFLDTVALEISIDAQSETESASYEIELGVIPEGDYYFELLLHDTETPDGEELLDSVWFKGLQETPPSTLDLADANYLIDSDSDGVADLNEELEGTDPADPDSTPEDPTVDVLFLYQGGSFEHLNSDSATYLPHVLHVTNDMYEKSESTIKFRAVGVLDVSTVPELSSGDPLEESRYLELLEEYRADLVAVYRPLSPFLCGFAATIGGIHGRGFLHPNERFPYIEMFLDPTTCPIDVTAHEIGHLLGLGHTYEQSAVGAFPWSRGHVIPGEFGTIMSYARILFRSVGLDVFSNPRLDCLGKPCGVPHTEPNVERSADAAQTMNILKYQFAQTSTPDPEFDYDGDGVGAVADAFPTDPDEWADTDGDQFGDNIDAFPDDPLEWADADGDGVGNNMDPDNDNDGLQNFADPNPFDPEENSLLFTAVRSDENRDEFGYFATRINDLNDDGTPDLAVTAPSGSNAMGEQSGKLYLLSLNDLTSPTDTPSTSLGAKSLGAVMSAGNSWEIHGSSADKRIGEQLAVLDHANDETELIVRGEQAIYIIALNAADLTALDAADESEDRQIALEHCESVDGCVRLSFASNLTVTDVAPVGDFNEDERIDIGIVAYADEQPDELLIYFLSREGFSNVTAGTEEDPFTLVDLFAADEASFLVSTPGFEGLADLEFLGGTLAAAKNDLVLGIPGNETLGRIYVIGGEELQSIDEFDEDDDRRIELDVLVGLDQTYRVSNTEDSNFGRSVDVLTDIDDDGRNDLMVWGSDGSNYVFTVGGIRFHDLNDMTLDGSVHLPEDAYQEFGTWFFNQIGKESPPSSSGTLLADAPESFDQLAFRRAYSMFFVELRDLDFLDDPTGEDLNGIVNLPIRIRYPDIYDIRAPFGPRGPMTLAGVTSVGDLDADTKTDFVFSVFSEETEGAFSTIYTVFTSELSVLDQADGDVDSIIMLQNDMADVDGDGVPNIHDDDDDNDGLRDVWDTYPHLAQFRYDADEDGYANTLDVFPLDADEHSDIDFDGIGDSRDDDADGDGILNDEDEFPLDTDNDGLPNRDDPDDDNDSVLDVDDLFPTDPSESTDVDNDGVGDNADEFDDDPNEAFDTDRDGIGNNADPDDDNDGYLDEDDAFPLDSEEWLDSDGDGYGDNADQFPLDPLEWEDLDGDGLGDNHGSAAFNSYRLLTDWERLPAGAFQILSAEGYRLGDFNRDGLDDIEIANALPNVAGQPLILLSSADLESLDSDDGQADKVIEIDRVHRGPSSWRFINAQSGFDEPRYIGGNVGDLDGDGIQDFGLSNPVAYNDSGAITIVYGDSWSDLDQADGQLDGEIDLHACVESKACIRIRSGESEHGFGLAGAPIANIFGEDEMSLVVGSLNGQSRQLGTDGVGSSFVMSHTAITESVAENPDGNVPLSDIEQHDQTYAFYSEFSGLLQAVMLVGRVPDLDQDSVDELLLVTLPTFFSPTSRIYILASSDLEGMDSADFTVDRKINLAASYRFPNSFRIDDFQLFQINMFTSTVQDAIDRKERSYFLPLLHTAEGTQASHLVDLRHLTEHDAADENTNGVVTTFDTNSNYSWTFPNLGLLSVCKPDVTTDRVQTIGSFIKVAEPFSASNPLEVIVFDTQQLASLDSVDGVEDGSIELDTALEQGTPNVWHISLGELTANTARLYVSCAGDFDGDGHEDVLVNLTHFDGQNVRGQVILIAYSDLATLDRLDGEEDYRIEAELLWPSG